MRILHTSDWYLGHKFYGHDRGVEHRHFLNWLLNALRQQLPDVLIVSGNVFDSSHPSAHAEKLFYDFLLEATEAVRGLQIVVISGNRDSAGSLEAAAQLLKRHNIYVRGTVKYTEEGNVDFADLVLPLSSRLHSEAEVVCLAIPYLRTGDYPEGMTLEEGLRYYFEQTMRQFKKSEFRKLPVVAAAHFLVQGTEISDLEKRERWIYGGQENIRPEVVERGFSYVAMGHVHQGQCIQGDSVDLHYAGGVLPLSFSELTAEYGVQQVDLSEDGRIQVGRLTYEPLRHLMVLPEEGSASVEEVFESIKTLPKRKKGESGDDWPYLEIRLRSQQANPELLHEVNRLLLDRAVHFCHMVREWSDSSTIGTTETFCKSKNALDPLVMAKAIFESRYHEEMPGDLVTRFKEAEEFQDKKSSL